VHHGRPRTRGIDAQATADALVEALADDPEHPDVLSAVNLEILTPDHD
jgi:hypothetical protein